MKWIKKLFKRKWPKRVRVEVRDGDCMLLDYTHIKIYNLYELDVFCPVFFRKVISSYPASEALDGAYCEYFEEEEE